MKDDDSNLEGTEQLISKTQQKKAVEAMQKMGLKLTKLSDDERIRLNLPDALEKAIKEYQRIKSNGALRRQAQYIGRLMRSLDCNLLQNQLDALLEDKSKANVNFAKAESWREALLSGDKQSLTNFISEFPQCDVQALRQIMTKAINEQKKGSNLGARKKLFRMIKQYIEENN